jgi:type IV secretory pathway VirB3-like protein
MSQPLSQEQIFKSKLRVQYMVKGVSIILLALILAIIIRMINPMSIGGNLYEAIVVACWVMLVFSLALVVKSMNFIKTYHPNDFKSLGVTLGLFFFLNLVGTLLV